MAPKFLIVDLFCGAGGTTTGFEQAQIDGSKICQVIACVNHDRNAIESHAANHPHTKHFFEDIRVLSMKDLSEHVRNMRAIYPEAKLILHASLECTNFSKAKGGQPRDADSRTLADHLDRYIIVLSPDYITIENVVEFMSWGPLDDNGKPISSKNGSDWTAWRKRINSYGYTDEWKELNSANYGAHTSRNRLFGIFARPHLPIVWPEPTHSKKKVKKGMSADDLMPWKPVREVLDLNDKGESIFTRKKALAPNTLERIYAGLIKFVAGGKEQHEAFLLKYNSMDRDGKYVTPSMEEPLGVIPTRNMHYLVQSQFITKYFSGKPDGKNISIDGPAGTVKTKDGQALVSTEYLQSYNGNGAVHSIDDPCATLPTHDRFAKVCPQFIQRDFTTGGGKLNDIDCPAGAITSVPKMSLARMDKRPPYLIETRSGHIAIEIYPTDCEMTIRIKRFMAAYGIVDILMRMLRIRELLQIQGFPVDYILQGTQADQKKQIGNAVVPIVPQRMAEALAMELQKVSQAA